MSSAVELCARGEKIHLPTVLSGGRTRSNSASISAPRPPVPKSASPGQDLLTSQLNDLSRKLVFTEDVVSTINPGVTSYALAKQRASKLYHYKDMLKIGQTKRRIAGGRHNIRGPGKRHLPCHLTHSDMPDIKLRKNRLTHAAPSRKHPLPAESPNTDTKDYVKMLERGAKPLYHSNRDTITLLDNNTVFRKVLQTCYPQPPSNYCLVEKDDPSLNSKKSCCKGRKKWVSLPQSIEPSEDLSWECRSISSTSQHSISEVTVEHSPTIYQPLQNQELFNIMKEWMNMWRIHIRLAEVSDDASLVRDMVNLSDNTRMLAVASVAVLAANEATLLKKRDNLNSPVRLHQKNVSLKENSRSVSDELVKELCRLLEDPALHVRVPSAITLYCMEKKSDKAREVLYSALDDPWTRTVERWAAVQCLVCAGETSASIISELLRHLLDPSDHLNLVNSHSSKQTKAADLLARTSTKTNLVHSMLADQLNNSGWQQRLAACNVLPLLHGSIKRDVCSKLLVMAWEDWSPEVRQEAAKALGRTCHGKLIHDEIAFRLTHESAVERLDAMRKLRSLNLMTSKLLPNYIACFSDQHFSIRIETIALAGSLKLKHPLVMAALKQQFGDGNWLVKAYALRALADVGVCDNELMDQLMWAVRFEKVPAVRAEACQTIARLNLKEDKVIKTLRDLITVEEDPLVVKEVRKTLVQLGHSDQVNDEMQMSVCKAVKQLGTKDKIASELTLADSRQITQYTINRPEEKLTIRDYLDDTRRFKVFGNGKRHWAPDRKTINSQLQKMRERVLQPHLLQV